MSSQSPQRIIQWIHALLLRLYPSKFQDTYAQEMLDVFSQSTQDAAEQGHFAMGMLFWRELWDAPRAALGEQLQEFKYQRCETESSGIQSRLSRPEMLIALAVFLIPAGFILLNATPSADAERFLRPAIWILLLLGASVGLIKRFPRWSLPYLGLVVAAIVFLYLFRWKTERMATFMAARFIGQTQNELGRLVLSAFWEGVVWLSLLILITTVVLIFALIPRFRHWFSHLREDWTQLSYLLYGGSMLALVMTFEEYRFQEPYALIALLCLAGGAWGYLRNQRRLRGFLSLLAGATLAMWISAVGIWLLVPYQTWTNWFLSHPPEGERWFEAQQALIAWAWMIAVLALPAMLKLIPRNRDTKLAT